MNDKDGPVIAKEFYKEIFKFGGENYDARNAAYALHKAVKCMRKSGVPSSRWAPFVHYGV